MQLKDRHALVTGGGTGIGLAIAQALAEQGAQVTITGRRIEVLEQAGTQGLHAAVMDVTDEAATRASIAQAAKDRGPIDICVANAGLAEPMPFAEADMAHWRKIMATNLDGAFVTIQAALATMSPDRYGRIIGVSSIAGVRGLKRAVAYTASKHALIGMIRGLSEEYMRSKITFNALCPGYVDTEIVTRNAAEISQSMGVSDDEARGYLAGGNRHKTLLEVDEIAGAALWLCSDAARSVNGQTVQIAGGQVS